MARTNSKKHTNGRGHSKWTGKTNTGHRDFTADFPNPKKQAYNLKELVRALTDFNRRPITERLSRHHIEMLKAPVQQPNDQQELRDMMGRYFKLYDRAFFFGALRPWVKNIDVRINPEHPTWKAWWDELSERIYINPRQDEGNDKGERWCCMLLHEMIHAFLMLFKCECNRYCMKRLRRAIAAGTDTGVFCESPISWNASIAVQRSLQAEVQWNVDLNVRFEVEQQLARQPNMKLRPEQLARWGFAGPVPNHPFPGPDPRNIYSAPPSDPGAPPSEAWAGRAFNPEQDDPAGFWSGSEDDHETFFPEDDEEAVQGFGDDHQTFMGSDDGRETIWPGAGQAVEAWPPRREPSRRQHRRPRGRDRHHRRPCRRGEPVLCCRVM